MNSTTGTCVCATNPYCQTQAVINEDIFLHENKYYARRIYNVSGWILGCSHIDSLFLSSLQCLYEDSDCFATFMSFAQELNNIIYDQSSSFDIEPLIYNPTVTRFPSNITLSIMFKNMMVEQWNPSSSYQSFYQSCAPSYCTYSQRIRTESPLGVIIKLISMIGGIIVSLKIVTPHFVKFILKLFLIFKKSQQQQRNERQQVHQSCVTRMKIKIQNLIKILSAALSELNIFSYRDFGSDIDRLTAKHYGRWATRLYLILFFSGLTILIFYTIIRPHSVTKTFDQPSFITYESLKKTYGDDLKCSCSRIASAYNQSVEINPIFHSICSSQFISEEWRINISNGLDSNLSIYSSTDYRRFLSAHIQYLQGLCRISRESVNNAINEFLASLLVTIELLSEEHFQNRIDTLIEQSKSNVPILFSRFLFMIKTVNHGNAFMSTYGTNFNYASWMNCAYFSYMHTEAMIYDDCSCGLSSTCTTQATFIDGNSSQRIPIKGLKMGCLPSESFHLSTLECFYDQSCLDILHQYTNYQYNSTPLAMTSSRFSPNTTIHEMINHSFIERWSKKMNYPSYYHQCLPLSCSYTYLEKFNILYIITLFLGLQGGLTLVLKWICPKLVQIVFKIYRYYRRQRTLIYPVHSIETPSNDIGIDNTHHNVDIQTTANITSEMNAIPQTRPYRRIILIIVLLVCLIVAVVIFSIYYARNVSVTNVTMNGSVNTTTSTLVSIFSITTESSCQTEFQQISWNISCLEHDVDEFLIATGDFNNDNQVDLIYVCSFAETHKIVVSLGNGDGTFQNSMILSFHNFHFIDVIHVADFNNDNRSDALFIPAVAQKGDLTILLSNSNGTFQHSTLLSFDDLSTFYTSFVADFNNDNQLDVLLIDKKGSFTVLLGNSNGTFQTQNILLSTETSGTPRKINLNDLNNDKILDIAVLTLWDKNLVVLFGNGNGTFSSKLILSLYSYSKPEDFIVGDVNNDNYSDIVVYDGSSGHIYVFFGTLNGTFQEQKPFFASINVDFYEFLMIDDFDNDNQSDIAFIYNWKDVRCMIYKYHNSSFKRNGKTVVESIGRLTSIILRDINGDNHLDIIMSTTPPNSIYALFGYGNGHFQQQIIYSRDTESYLSDWFSVADFNNDNYPDIIITSRETMLINIFLNKRECSIV